MFACARDWDVGDLENCNVTCRCICVCDSVSQDGSLRQCDLMLHRLCLHFTFVFGHRGEAGYAMLILHIVLHDFVKVSWGWRFAKMLHDIEHVGITICYKLVWTCAWGRGTWTKS